MNLRVGTSGKRMNQSEQHSGIQDAASTPTADDERQPPNLLRRTAVRALEEYGLSETYDRCNDAGVRVEQPE